MEVHGDNTQNISRRPDADHSGSSRTRKLLPHWLTPVRQVILVISILVIALFIDVVLYTVFVAAYGTLLPIVVTKERDAWEWLALGLMVFAIGLDLYRIANSLGDLYTTTMRHLTPGQIH